MMVLIQVDEHVDHDHIDEHVDYEQVVGDDDDWGRCWRPFSVCHHLCRSSQTSSPPHRIWIGEFHSHLLLPTGRDDICSKKVTTEFWSEDQPNLPIVFSLRLSFSFISVKFDTNQVALVFRCEIWSQLVFIAKVKLKFFVSGPEYYFVIA